MANVTFPVPADIIPVPVRKIEGEFNLDIGKLSPDMIHRIFMYGVVQITNDCHSSVKVSDGMSDDELLSAHQAVTGAINKRWDAIYSGEWRVRTASGESVDPVTREAMRLARESVIATVRAAGKKWKDYSDEQKDAATEKAYAKNEAMFRKSAEKAIAERKAAQGSVSLADLGL